MTKQTYTEIVIVEAERCNSTMFHNPLVSTIEYIAEHQKEDDEGHVADDEPILVYVLKDDGTLEMVSWEKGIKKDDRFPIVGTVSHRYVSLRFPDGHTETAPYTVLVDVDTL